MPTIKDLALDPNTLDMAIRDGDAYFIYDADVVAQMLRIRLKRVLGEWFLDTTKGVDYLGTVLAKGAPRSAREAALRDVILGTEYVGELARFEATYDNAERLMDVEFEVTTEFGPVAVKVEAP